jgi:hypothetical protein
MAGSELWLAGSDAAAEKWVTRTMQAHDFLNVSLDSGFTRMDLFRQAARTHSSSVAVKFPATFQPDQRQRHI